MATRIRDLLVQRSQERFALHERHLNTQMVRVLRTIGFDRHYVRGEGPFLFDDDGHRYLDLLSGFGVFALGRNHPTITQALRDVLDAGLPGLVQMDVSALAGILAERLVATAPGDLDKVFFANSGAETVEAAIKFARMHTGRPGLAYCEHGFHGLTLGALSVNGEGAFREGFGPLLPHSERVPWNDLAALERVLASRQIAAFIVEPIQGHGVNLPDDDYLPEAARLCRKHGTLFVADEIQTGLGRTGRFWAVEHWGVEPDLLLSAKALSGGFAPVGAVLLRRDVFDSVFSNMLRAPVHGSTFSKNDLAMAAGIATLEVIQEHDLCAHAERTGRALLADLAPLVSRYDFVHDVRGLGLMTAIEFAPPERLKLRAAYRLVDTAQKGLFSQLVTVPLFQKHRILSQTAGHDLPIVKFLPPLVIGDAERRWIRDAVDAVVAETQRPGGAIWDLGKHLASAALRTKRRSAPQAGIS
ncbi:MAG: aspartate aminotransferase family protein [Myxococcota bacterium]